MFETMFTAEFCAVLEDAQRPRVIRHSFEFPTMSLSATIMYKWRKLRARTVEKLFG